MKLKLVSDGTPGGTHLIDSDTGESIPGVNLVEWSADATKQANFVTVRLHNVPVEITCAADVNISAWDNNVSGWSTYETRKMVTVTSELNDSQTLCSPLDTEVRDTETGELVTAVQRINVKIDTDGCTAELDKILYDNTEWV